MVVHYPKEGGTDDDDWYDNAITETYVTNIVDDKLVTKELEGME